MKNKEQFIVSFRLNNQREKNGLLPIYIKISVLGQRAEMPFFLLLIT